MEAAADQQFISTRQEQEEQKKKEKYNKKNFKRQTLVNISLIVPIKRLNIDEII